MKKILITGLALALTAVLTVGGTLAYLTDRDSEANVFTVGNVDIELIGDFKGETGAAVLTPGVDVDLNVQIENVGPNDAWVWCTYAVPKELDGVMQLDHSSTPWEPDYEFIPAGWIDDRGITYNVYAALYTDILPAGDITTVGLSKIWLDRTVDVDPAGGMHQVDAGTVTDLAWNVNQEGKPTVYVKAYAIQADTFNDEQAAYTAYIGQWSELN